MFWIRSGLYAMSISDWLTSAPAALAEPPGSIEAARQAMLDALGSGGRARRSRLSLKINQADDAQGLWALRAELMTAVSQLYGESEGHARLNAVTASFQGLIPQARALTTTRRGLAMQRRI